MRRKLRPPPEVTAAPLCISDETSFDLVGLKPRPFREFLLAQKIPHARLGHRVVVRAELVLAAIDRLATGEAVPVATTDEESTTSVDDVLRRLGMRRVG